jgi:dihydrofolate reductase
MSRKIIATNYVSLDGVIEDPVGMENSGLGDWTGPFTRGPVGDKFKEDELLDCDAMIYGRRTYDGFAAVWPTVPGPFADRMNALPKYLASRTITAPAWNNTKVLGEDLIGDVRKLKAQPGGNILIYGSASIVHALMPHGLIDEFALMVFPTVLGRGKKLFPDGTSARMELQEQHQFGDGIMLLKYACASKQ